MFEWYAGLPVWLKYGVALLILGASAVLFTNGLFWAWGWGVGLVLLLAAVLIGDGE
jgi:hypothetical protein